MKIPYFTEGELESYATQTRNGAIADGVDDSFPLEVEAVAEFHLNYELTYTSCLPMGIDGETSWTSRTIRISDAIKNDGRCRFTIAHEIGHIVLHVPLFIAHEQQNPLFSNHVPLYRDRRLETQADMFASSFLMPREAVIALYQSHNRRNGLITPEEVSATFGTSRQAAQVRLEVIGLFDAHSPGRKLNL